MKPVAQEEDPDVIVEDSDEEEDVHQISPPEYGEKKYWDHRYHASHNGIYDWYQDYDSCVELKKFICEHVRKTDKILMVGCGNSQMSEQMYLDGFTNIISIDFSAAAIAIMKQRALDKGYTLEYLEMDARNMTLPDNSVDCVIDKGTIDAMMCGANNSKNTRLTCSQIFRVLKPGGVFLSITYGKPESRLDHFDQPDLFDWKVSWKTISRPSEESFHYLYWMVKNA